MNNRTILDFETGMQRRLANMPNRLRLFTSERQEFPRAFLLTGPRGVGKTTCLLHHIREKNYLYFSADNPVLAGEGLYDVVKSIFLAGFAGVVIDEVHFARQWSLHLKALYDDFPKHGLWISDSSALVLRSGVGDLSRRYVPIKMPFVSFREFLFLETGNIYPVIDPFHVQTELPVTPSPEILASFRKYRACGTRPFYSDGNFEERLLAVLDKTLYYDIPFFLPRVTEGNLRLMKAIVGTLAQSAVPRLHVRSLCADWAIGAEKLYEILAVMEAVDLLRILRLEHDNKARSVGEKLFFADPAFYAVLQGNSGTAREALAACLVSSAGWIVEAVRDETAGDFVLSRNVSAGIETLKLEVGGAHKKSKCADFVIRDDLDYPAGNAIPLWLLGMAY